MSEVALASTAGFDEGGVASPPGAPPDRDRDSDRGGLRSAHARPGGAPGARPLSGLFSRRGFSGLARKANAPGDESPGR